MRIGRKNEDSFGENFFHHSNYNIKTEKNEMKLGFSTPIKSNRNEIKNLSSIKKNGGIIKLSRSINLKDKQFKNSKIFDSPSFHQNEFEISKKISDIKNNVSKVYNSKKENSKQFMNSKIFQSPEFGNDITCNNISNDSLNLKFSPIFLNTNSVKIKKQKQKKGNLRYIKSECVIRKKIDEETPEKEIEDYIMNSSMNTPLVRKKLDFEFEEPSTILEPKNKFEDNTLIFRNDESIIIGKNEKNSEIYKTPPVNYSFVYNNVSPTPIVNHLSDCSEILVDKDNFGKFSNITADTIIGNLEKSILNTDEKKEYDKELNKFNSNNNSPYVSFELFKSTKKKESNSKNQRKKYYSKFFLFSIVCVILISLYIYLNLKN